LPTRDLPTGSHAFFEASGDQAVFEFGSNACSFRFRGTLVRTSTNMQMALGSDVECQPAGCHLSLPGADAGTQTFSEDCPKRPVQRMIVPLTVHDGRLVLFKDKDCEGLLEKEPAGAPTPRLSDADVGHVLSAEEIRGVVLASLAPLRQCYESEASRDRNLRGEVSVVFEIARSGDVTEVRIKRSSLGNSAAEKCMVEAVRRLRFPSSAQKSTVEWPFIFGPRVADAGN
jgi:TonB family protein